MHVFIMESMLFLLLCVSSIWSAPTSSSGLASSGAEPKTPRFFNFLENFEKEIKSSSSLGHDKALNFNLDSLAHSVLHGDNEKHFPSVVHKAQEVKKAQEFEVSVGRHCRTYVDADVSSESGCYLKYGDNGHCYWDEHRSRVDDFFDNDVFKFSSLDHKFGNNDKHDNKFEKHDKFDDKKGYEPSTPKGACVCPRSFKQCLSEKRCYWFHDPHHEASSECISSAERLYKVLSKLLLRRGKKDFAIRIDYKSAPARGLLPYGPHGPAIFGFGDVNSPYDTITYGPNANVYSGPDVYGPNSFGPNSIGINAYGPNVHGPSAFGPNIHGPNGYGPNIHGPNVYGPRVPGPNAYGPNVLGSNVYGPNVHGPVKGVPNVYGPNVYGPVKGGPNVYGPSVSVPNVHSSSIVPNVYGPGSKPVPVFGGSKVNKDVYSNIGASKGSSKSSDVYSNIDFGGKNDVFNTGPIRQKQFH